MGETLLAAALLLAFTNGANDNMKGVATLYGSGALSYRGALGLATVSTALGSLLALPLAMGLVKVFSARGLVPDHVLGPAFLAAVALGAATTVLIATR
ncbi:MAG: inorganic phosphate transporter, partial [Myxococcota bacterium]